MSKHSSSESRPATSPRITLNDVLNFISTANPRQRKAITIAICNRPTGWTHTFGKKLAATITEGGLQ